MIGLAFSFVGSIPPGTLNILVLQLGLENKIKVALRFALAVSVVEYPYAWIAVVFEDWITSSPLVLDNFQLTGASVMTRLSRPMNTPRIGSSNVRSTSRTPVTGSRMPNWVSTTSPAPLKHDV